MSAEYARIRVQLSECESRLARERSALRRADAARSLEELRRGDIIQVTAGRRAGIAVVLEQRPAGILNVLTAGRQVRRLSAADFSGPVQPVDRIRVPAWFSERSAKHRRDLAVTVKSQAGRARPRAAAALGGNPGRGGGRAAAAAARAPVPCLPGPRAARAPGREVPQAAARGRGAGAPRGRPDARHRPHLPPGLRGAGPARVPARRRRDRRGPAAGRPVHRA